MAQKLFSTGPRSLMRAQRKDGIDHTSCERFFQSEMVLGMNEYL